VVRARAARRTGRLSRQAAPLLAILGVLVHLAGTVGGYLHFALVAHERCPLHGELVHASGQDAGAATGQAALPRDRGDGGPIASRAGDSPQDGHDVCAVTAVLPSRAAPPPSEPGGQIEPPSVDGAAPAAEGPFLAARAGYRVAPKTSPPPA
jgi:hypothetical protein